MRSRGPSARDLSRLVLARASARLALSRAGDAYASAYVAAFQAELGATVRSVSPFLIALLAQDGMEIDEIVWAIEPLAGWPDSPRLPLRGGGPVVEGAAFGRSVGTGGRVGGSPLVPVERCHRAMFVTKGGDSISVHVVDQCIEVSAVFAEQTFTSSAGLLHVDFPLPTRDVRSAMQVGAPLRYVVRLPVFAGRPWTVRSVAAATRFEGVVVSSRIGVRPYRMPWTRPLPPYVPF